MIAIKKYFLSIVLIPTLIVSVFSGCVGIGFNGTASSGKPVLRGEGKMVSQTFTVDSYTSADIRGYYEVIYSNSESGKVVVELQENLALHLKISVSDGVLTVDSDREFRVGSDNIPKLYIYTPTLEGLDISGAITMKNSDAIKADSFNLKVSGAGDASLSLDVGNLSVSCSGAGSIHLAGTADIVDISLSGAGDVSALDLQAQTAKVSISGAGTTRISCSESIDVSISGVGTLEYSGNPKITQKISGVGSVRNVD